MFELSRRHSRVRRDHGAENLALLRRMTLNLIKQDTATKGSIKGKRKRAAWSADYLGHLLGLSPMPVSGVAPASP